MLSRWTHPEKLALAALSGILVASLPFLIHPWFDATNDGSMYILLARSLLRDHAYTLMGDPFVIRPPGFPLLVAPVIAAFGTNFLALNSLISSIGALGVLLLYVYLRPNLGWALSVLVALAVWFNPGYQQLCNQTMSDIPAAALVVLSLLCARWAEASPSVRRELALALCVALTLQLRTAHLVLVPAIILARFAGAVRRGGSDELLSSAKHAAAFLALLALLMLPWSLYSRLHSPPPPADQTLVHSYATATFRTDHGDPESPRVPLATLLERVPERALNIVDILGNRLTQTTTLGWWQVRVDAAAVGFSVFLLFCTGIVLLRRRQPGELFVLGVLVLILPYSGFGPRFMLPVYMLMLPCAVEVVRDLFRLVVGERRAMLATGALLVLLTVTDLDLRSHWPGIEKRHDAFVSLARALEPRLAPDAQLASAFGPHYGVYLDRPVYSLMFAVKRAGIEVGVESILDKYEVDTVILPERERRLTDYFKKHYGAGRPIDGSRIWRVRKRGP